MKNLLKKLLFLTFTLTPCFSFSSDLNLLDFNKNILPAPNAYHQEMLPNWLIVNFSGNELVVLDKKSLNKLDYDTFVINLYTIFNEEQKFNKDISVEYFSKRLVIDCESKNEVSFSSPKIYYAGHLLENSNSKFDDFYKNLNLEYSLSEDEIRSDVWLYICQYYNFKNENGDLSISFNDEDVNKLRNTYRYMIKYGG